MPSHPRISSLHRIAALFTFCLLLLAGSAQAYFPQDIETWDHGIEGGQGPGWSTTPSWPWRYFSHDDLPGGRSVRSAPDLGHGEQSDLTFSGSFPGAGLVSYDIWVSSEANYDEFVFSVDGQCPPALDSNGVEVTANDRCRLSGESNGFLRSIFYVISGGPHDLTFSYRKDNSASSGGDFVLIDNLHFFLVPEPSPSSSIAASLLTLAWLRVRRNRLT
jgi:hypothetical protein